MDDVQRLDFQKTLLSAADKLEACPRAERIRIYDAMIDKTFTFTGAEFARCLHFNACLATELRRRNVSLAPANG